MMEQFTVDLPEYAPWIMIDGVRYLHGQTYVVPFLLGRSMAEIQWNAWGHQRQTSARVMKMKWWKMWLHKLSCLFWRKSPWEISPLLSDQQRFELERKLDGINL